jgi:hypothetical protein
MHCVSSSEFMFLGVLAASIYKNAVLRIITPAVVPAFKSPWIILDIRGIIVDVIPRKIELADSSPCEGI